MTVTRDEKLRIAQRRLESALAAEGRPWPGLCAAVLVTRGGLGLDVKGFAEHLGVSPSLAQALERGGCEPIRAPVSLRAVEPAIDWDAVGLRPTPNCLDLGAERHPSIART